MGEATRRSTSTKATNETAATASRPMVRGEAQPHSGENVSGTSRQTRNTPSSAEPATSRRGAALARSQRGSIDQPQTSTRIPMGRLMRKIQRQPIESAMKPPSGPRRSGRCTRP